MSALGGLCTGWWQLTFSDLRSCGGDKGNDGVDGRDGFHGWFCEDDPLQNPLGVCVPVYKKMMGRQTRVSTMHCSLQGINKASLVQCIERSRLSHGQILFFVAAIIVALGRVDPPCGGRGGALRQVIKPIAQSRRWASK